MAFIKPLWTEQGPGPFAMPIGTYDKATGAVQAIVVDPVNPDRVFVATVGGGIWMTEDAISSTNPTWVPQSDFAPSLSMSALAMSPLDPNRNTLYAGSGITSHGLPLVGPRAGPLFGLLKTVNGGKDWLEIARAEFQGKSIARIAPLAVQSAQGDRVLVVTESGLHVSPDGGSASR